MELLGPLSQELDIPLSVLLDVEELTTAVGDSKGQGFETLLAEILALMKERVQEEFRSKKRMKTYEESIHIFSEEDIEIVSVQEKDGTVFLDLRILNDTALRYGVLERHWYDGEDTAIRA